jgi:peptide/nickel transport system substrate-binding protein
MDAEKRNYYWTRRTFLREVGLGTLSLAGISTFRVHPEAWAAAKPTRFVYAWTAFDLLDPHIKYDGNAYFFNLNMYDNLLRYQGNPPKIVPWLAERDEAADAGRGWAFHLQRGVTFHDGSEVTAEAVHYSFARPLALGKGPAAIFRRMGLTAERIRVIDPYTVEFSLEQPFGPFRVAIPIVSMRAVH